MQCYAELTPPTAVTHSLYLPFLSAQSNNLIVARASLLQIFTTKSVSAELDNAQKAQLQSSRSTEHYDTRVNDDSGLEASFLGGETAFIRSDRSIYTKLVLIAEFPLAGTVTGLARIKNQTSASDGESLLLSFRDAKLSMIQWDPEKHTIFTTSIHYYEQDDLQASPWAAPLGSYVNFLAADPASRCAALKFGTRSLAIIQFKSPTEDIDMDDWDEELDGPRPVKELSTTLANGTSSNEETPYSTSFVLRLPNLDPSLIHPVHLAFLHEYREPTFGILSSSTAPSSILGRKDHLSYMVFTLDIQQRASTTILSVDGLPQDLFRVIALPAPVGGALLIGTNELIHVDQSGKTHGVGVNPFAKQTTSFSLVDQSDLQLRLEGCEIEILSPETGELIMVLNDGNLVLVNFRIDGRTVSGLSLRLVGPEAGGRIVPDAATTLSKLGKSSLFVGSDSADSMVIGWMRKQTQVGKKKPRFHDPSLGLDLDDEDLEDMEDDDDDLYGDDAAPTQQTSDATNGAGGKAGELVFRVHDRLVSIAPIRDFTIGQSIPADGSPHRQDINSDLGLVCAVGRGRGGAVAIINRNIQPKVISEYQFPEARGFWTMAAQKPIPKSLQSEKGSTSMGADYDTTTHYDKYMITSKVDLDGYETSDVYTLAGPGFKPLTGTEFDPAAGFTIEAGTMGKHMRVIQVLKTAVHCYDGDFGLSQIVPMIDEETGAEPRVTSASIADPYILLVRDDASIFIAKMDKNLELEELEKEDDSLSSTKWATGCLYEDVSSVFSKEERTDKGVTSGDNIVMFLLSKTGTLHVYALPNLSQPIYVAEGLSYVPPVLSANFAARRGMAKESIREILVADLGDHTSSSPYLIARHDNNDLTIYEPFRIPSDASAEVSKALHFQKVPNPTLAETPEEIIDEDEQEEQQRFLPMRRCENIGGYRTVFLPGYSPSFILKSSKTLPKVIGLQATSARAMSPFHVEGCERGFIYTEAKGSTRISQIPVRGATYAEIGMSLRKLPLKADTHSITYHPPSNTYVLGCDRMEPFELPKEDDYHKEWLAEKDLTFKPTVERGLIKLINPSTWTVIDTIEMEPCETVMCVETLNLEVSESTNERKHLITIGTAVARGEDLPIRGRIIVYDIVSVIPEPGRPETNKKLKLVAKEDIPRGAVTALSEIGTQGLMLVAQGQKCMVRGLKEDGTLLPVAFMDMNCYVTAVRELKSAGLCLLADAVKGVWFAGYTEEPYRMIPFAKSSTKLEVLTVDFLPDGSELFIIVCDSDGGIHILQYDPDHPKSLQGQLLLHRTTFAATANPPTRSMLLPRTLPPASDYHAQIHATTNGGPLPSSSSPDDDIPTSASTILLTSPTGLIATLSPLTEPQYRRLSFLTGQLHSSLPQHAGLNPKDYRSPLATGAVGRFPPGVDAGMGRSLVDGAVLARWNELGAGRKAEVAGRVGFSGGVEEVRMVLGEVLGTAGVGYL